MLAAADTPPAHKDGMVNGMVEGLEKRLKTNPTDLNGWVMLVRSYKVLREPDKQKAAIDNARRALANDQDKLKQFDAALKNIESGAAPAPAAGMSPHQNAQAGKPAKTEQHEGATINTMVERLHEKLKKSGDNPGGWLMLTRSYLTMKQKDKAMAAIAEARDALAASPDKLDQFEGALKHYKIDAPK